MNPYETHPITPLDAATPRMPNGFSLLVSYLQCYLFLGLCFAGEVALVIFRDRRELANDVLRWGFCLDMGMKVFVFSLVFFALLIAIDFFFKSTRVRVVLYVLFSILSSSPIIVLCVIQGANASQIAHQASSFIWPCLAYSLFRITRQRTSKPQALGTGT